MRDGDKELIILAQNGDKNKMMQILDENKRANMEDSKKILL